MPDVETAYEHHVAAWTVGQLRAALEGIPDDYPVQGLFAAHQVTEIRDGHEIKRPESCREADFASGTYVKSEGHN